MRQPNDRYVFDRHWTRWGVWDVLEPRRVLSVHDHQDDAQHAADQLNQAETRPAAAALATPTLFDPQEA